MPFMQILTNHNLYYKLGQKLTKYQCSNHYNNQIELAKQTVQLLFKYYFKPSMFFKGLRNAVSLTKFNFVKMSTEANLKPSINRQPRQQQFMKVTDSAKNRILQLMRKKNDQSIVGLKIGLSKKGCNGLTYVMNYIGQEGMKKFDEVVDLNNGVKVIIDSKAIMAIIGTELDYVQSQIGSEFVFRNPNEKGRCGCGQSFHI